MKHNCTCGHEAMAHEWETAPNSSGCAVIDCECSKYEWDGIEVDICGFCAMPGADKIPAPVQWPNEKRAGTEFVHAECEDKEVERAHSLLTQKQRDKIIDDLLRGGD